MSPVPKWFKPLATGVVVLVMALLLAGILAVPYRSTRPPEGYNQSRLHWNTKNTTRFTGDHEAEIASRVSRAVYPGGENGSSPDVVLLFDPADWQSGLAAASLLKPLNAVLLPAVDGIDAEIERLAPGGSDTLDGAQIVTLSNATAPEGDFSVIQLTIADLATTRDEAAIATDHTLLVDADEPKTALLAAPWVAYSGDSVIFDAADAPANVPVFALGDVEGDADVRIDADSPAALAVKFAAYDNADYPLFGWGFNADSLTGYRGFTIANPNDPALALLSANLNIRGKPGPLLWSDERKVPQIVNNYMWSQRAAFWNTPSEGPFHHFFILGDLDTITFPAQSQADYAVEIGPYKEKGAGLGGTDMLAAIWVALGIASAGWIAVHQARFLPVQNWLMRLAWPLLALMIGPFSIPLYCIAHNRPVIRRGNMLMFDRPLWMQGMVATVSAVGFGASLMIVTGYIATTLGLPVFPNEYGLFWLGAPMVVVMIINYIVAAVVSWLLFQTPMLAMFYGESYVDTLPKSLPMVLVSMLAAALAMNPGMWWLMMWNLPMMPTEESILWFGVMFFTGFLAFLMAWPFNYLFVRMQRKSGLM